jgi:hypothetical protein
MSSITYTPQFVWKDYCDFVDTVQAGGANGINARMHAIEGEFSTLSGVVSQVNAGLFFQPVGTAGAVAYGGGSVGIGAFAAATPPTYGFEVNLSDNANVGNQVRFGNAVCCNGNTGTFSSYAVFAHKSHASDGDFALRQGPNGNVYLNAAAGQPVTVTQGGASIRMGISVAGNVIVGAASDLPGAGAALLQVAGDAFKLSGTSAWLISSDGRLKQDVRDLELGLAQLQRVRTVRFRYNGRAGTPAGQAGVGVLGQEIEKIFPEMIRRIPGAVEGEPDLQDLRVYDSSLLTYVLVNAVKELAGRVEHLEQALAEARQETGPTDKRPKPRTRSSAKPAASREESP